MEFNATFIVSAISFIVFTVIMNAIFYKPLQNIAYERQKFIDDTNKAAKFNKAQSELIIKEREKKLEQTKHDAKKIIVDKTEEVKTKKSTLASEAQKKAIREVESAKNELQKSREEAQTALHGEVKKLAEIISVKVLGKI